MSEQRSSADSAQPEVWMWRATVGGVWGSWRLLDQPIDEFKKSAWGFNLGNGTAEIRALYARPERTEPQTAPMPQNVEVAIKRMKTLADTALPGRTYEEECQAQMRNACVLLEMAYRSQADSSPQATPELTATCQKLLPGGIVDDATYAEIEDALDRAEAPSIVGGRWLKLHERIAALTAERTAAAAEPQSQAVSASVREAELEEALRNLMGIYDTPVSRRRYRQDQFMKEALDIARAALTRPKCGG